MMPMDADVIALIGTAMTAAVGMWLGVRKRRFDLVADQQARERALVDRVEHLDAELERREQQRQHDRRTGHIEVTAAQAAEYRRLFSHGEALRTELAGCVARREAAVEAGEAYDDAREVNLRRFYESTIERMQALVDTFESEPEPVVTESPWTGELLVTRGRVTRDQQEQLRKKFPVGPARGAVVLPAGVKVTPMPSVLTGFYEQPKPTTPCLEGHEHEAEPVDGIPAGVEPRWLCRNCLTDVDGDGKPVASPLAIDDKPQGPKFRPRP